MLCFRSKPRALTDSIAGTLAFPGLWGKCTIIDFIQAYATPAGPPIPLILVVLLLLLLFGGGGFYGFNTGLYGGSAFGGISVVGLLLIVLVIYLLMGRGRL